MIGRRAAAGSLFWRYLKEGMNEEAIAEYLDAVILAGHSSGGSACVVASSHLADTGGPKPVAMGLVAPAADAKVSALAATAPPLIVFKGSQDTDNHANPEDVYQTAPAPKAMINITGANHFGYTEICSPDNTVCPAIDAPGTIPRVGQQLIGAAYLATLLPNRQVLVAKYAVHDAEICDPTAGKSSPTSSLINDRHFTQQRCYSTGGS